jgi:Flp pilus assembly protein CpaB
MMLAAGLVGALATMTVLRSADDRVPVLIARDDLAPGTVVEADDFRVARVQADPSAMSRLVHADDLDALAGRVVTARIGEGRFVVRDDLELAADARARRSMSFPIERSRALDGQLVAGDRVDVVATSERRADADYVATDVEVLRVGGGGGSSPLGGTDTLTVTLAVDASNALDLATALHGGDLVLVRSTGAAAADG